MKLITMSDFVLQKYSEWVFDDNLDLNSSERYISSTQNYANFLKQPLKLGMFIPCDADGNVLELPIYKDLSPFYHNNKRGNNYNKRFNVLKDYYNLSKSNVIFEGFEIKERSCNSSVFKYVENGFIAPYYFNINSQKFEENTNDLKIIEDLIPYNLDLAVSF